MAVLDGKIAIVTGAGGGIGRGIAHRFAKEGARVVVAEVDAARGRESVAEIQQNGGDARFVECDVSQELHVERAFREAIHAYGGLDILVHNANGGGGQGIGGRPFLRYTATAWNDYMRANMGAMFYTNHRAAQFMCAQRRGCIINISTNAVVRVHRRSVAYDTMKGALDVLTMALAVELAPWGVRVNVLRPGLIGTSAYESTPEDVRVRRASQVPLGRYGFPADLAWAALFLASDEAGYVTGQGFQVDGGLLTQGRSPAGELNLPVLAPDNIDQLFPVETAAAR